MNWVVLTLTTVVYEVCVSGSPMLTEKLSPPGPLIRKNGLETKVTWLYSPQYRSRRVEAIISFCTYVCMGWQQQNNNKQMKLLNGIFLPVSYQVDFSWPGILTPRRFYVIHSKRGWDLALWDLLSCSTGNAAFFGPNRLLLLAYRTHDNSALILNTKWWSL